LIPTSVMDCQNHGRRRDPAVARLHLSVSVLCGIRYHHVKLKKPGPHQSREIYLGLTASLNSDERHRRQRSRLKHRPGHDRVRYRTEAVAVARLRPLPDPDLFQQ
jgi:hypothetical protein